MDLFDLPQVDTIDRPLAERLRPKDLKDFVGQRQAQGPWRILDRTFREGAWPPNLIFWGPPGTGKTTMARLLCDKLSGHLELLHGVDLGAKELRRVGDEAHERKRLQGVRTLVFVDEIHRLNRAQQDVLLPYCERGDFVLVGATTENPAYALTSALLSRCRIVVFEGLDEESLGQILDRSLASLGHTLKLSPEARNMLIKRADGDARTLLNQVELIISQTMDETSSTEVSADDLREWLGALTPRHDARGDQHYDVISAFIKSIRGSDPDASVYYLARMLEGGEDPLFIARRLVILASEDVGNADPRALQVAVSGLQAVELVGLPEAAINLAQVSTYMASAPKSNASYKALRSAQAVVRETGSAPVPLALRSGQGKALKELGYGEGYKYSHEGEKGFIEQEFLPAKIKGQKFYLPKNLGFEKNIRQYLEWMRGKSLGNPVSDNLSDDRSSREESTDQKESSSQKDL